MIDSFLQSTSIQPKIWGSLSLLICSNWKILILSQEWGIHWVMESVGLNGFSLFLMQCCEVWPLTNKIEIGQSEQIQGFCLLSPQPATFFVLSFMSSLIFLCFCLCKLQDHRPILYFLTLPLCKVAVYHLRIQCFGFRFSLLMRIYVTTYQEFFQSIHP